jgi:hypothetical protein
MSLSTASFSVSQSIGSPSVITLTDTSTGSDGTLTSRHIYLQKADGTYLVPAGTTTDYIVWDYANPSISIDVLDKDYCLQITVKWMAGAAIVYTATNLTLFTLYLWQFYYQLTQNQTSTPNIVNDTDYYDNKMKLRCSIDEAVNAVTYGADIVSAQSALNRGKYLVDNQNLFF